MPVAFDLNELSQKLPNSPDVKALRGLIAKVRDTYSAIRDLQSADRYLRILAALDVDGGDWGIQEENYAINGRALFTAAVIEYARATQTQSANRKNYGYTKSYNADQLKHHKRIMDLRNDAFAHWGPGLDKDGRLWNEQRITLVVDDEGGLTLRHPYQQANYRGADATDLSDLVCAALEAAEAAHLHASDQLLRRLGPLGADPVFRATAERCRFDPADFFASHPDLIAQFWSNDESTTVHKRSPA